MKSAKAIAIATTVLLGISLFWLINTRTLNHTLESGLQKERIKSEALLSEKLKAEKDLKKIKEQLTGLKGENQQLNDLVERTSAKLASQEALLSRTKKDNASMAQLRKQRDELSQIQRQLQQELAAIQNSYANLETENRKLNATVALLQEKNNLLRNDLDRAVLASIDQTEIQARKRSERLTVRAKRTKKLIANFEVPANLKNLSFRLINAKGDIFTPDQGTIAISTAPSESTFTASTSNELIADKSQKIQMTYLPKERLKSGTYSVEILSDNIYVASMRVNLK